ncbi:GMP synthase [Minicystis rosea]|nr:GMP synthase [Minicystis rosea]
MSTPHRPARKIVIVRTGEPVPEVLDRRGHFHDLIEQAIGADWSGGYEVFDAREPDPFPAPNAAAAYVITGSAANVPNREAWMLRTEAWLRDVFAAGTPMFGICFGHQILAQALGGEVQRNPRGREIGTVEIERTAEDPIFQGVPARFSANVTHVDTVVRLPPGAAPLARSALESHHAIRFGERCYGVQFHPEMDADVLSGYVETRREILSTEGFGVDAMLAEIRDAEMGRETLRNFVRRFV